jgi:hypothetical protein
MFVAPFLHGSARNQAFQADAAKHSAVPVSLDDLPKVPDKVVSTSTWILGSTETIAVVAMMITCYWLSGRIARHREAAAAAPAAGPGELVDA